MLLSCTINLVSCKCKRHCVCVVILGKGVKALSESVFTVDGMLTYVCLCMLE